jgi:outer membrane lipoprotein LolB
VISPRRLLACAFFTALFLIAGCAQPPLATGPYSPYGTENNAWRGRLALRIDGVQGGDPQSISASFDLVGQARAGELMLYGPLGSTAAHLNWTPDAATLRSQGTVRNFNSLSELAQQATGTDLPIAALFDWLAGRDLPVPGWQADLSQLGQGRLTARRTHPEPAAELRLILEP